MGDGYYDSAGPGYGVGYGPPPHVAVGLIVLILILLLIMALAGVAYRQGAAAERRRLEFQRTKTGAVIFHAVRTPLNGALLATGEQVFAPARRLLETIDLYLGPMVLLLGGFGAIQQLRKALNVTIKEVEVKHDAHSPAAHAPAGATMIFTAPTAISAAAGEGMSIAKGVAPPAEHGHAAPGHGDHGHAEKKKVELTSKEQARAVREALEHLSDFWQEDRVKDLIGKAQAALLITAPIGTVGERATERALFFGGRRPTSSPPDKPGQGTSKIFPLFKL